MEGPDTSSTTVCTVVTTGDIATRLFTDDSCCGKKQTTLNTELCWKHFIII